jgi:hypothetical protein
VKQIWTITNIWQNYHVTHLQTIMRPARMHDAHENSSAFIRLDRRPTSSIFNFWKRFSGPSTFDVTLVSIWGNVRLLGLKKRKCITGRGPSYRNEFLWKRFSVNYKWMISNHLQSVLIKNSLGSTLISPFGPKGASYAVAAKTVSNDSRTFCVL